MKESLRTLLSKEKTNQTRPGPDHVSSSDFAFPSYYLGLQRTIQAAEKADSESRQTARYGLSKLWQGVLGCIVVLVLLSALILLSLHQAVQTLQADVEAMPTALAQPVEQPDLEDAKQSFAIQKDANLPESVVADGNQGVYLVFQIFDGQGLSAPDGTLVHFEASGGKIGPLAIVQEGQARTRFVPKLWQDGDRDQAIIGVSVGGVEQAFTVDLEQPESLTLDLDPERTNMLADGAETIVVTVRVHNAQGQSKERVSVALWVEPGDFGSIEPGVATTDNNGQFQATLTAGEKVGTLTLVAETQNEPKDRAESKIELVSATPVLNITPGEEELVNTGFDEIPLNVTLADQLERHLANVPIRLEIPLGMGWFLDSAGQPTENNSIELLTDENGHIEATFRAGTSVGPVEIVVEALGVRETVALNVDELKPTSIEIDSGGTTLLADGTDVPLAIKVLDQQKNPMPGEVVYLEATPAEVVELAGKEVTADEYGDATTTFKALNAAENVVITARAGEASGQIVLTLVVPETVTIEAEPMELPADGTSSTKLSIVVLDQRGEPLPGIKGELAVDPPGGGDVSAEFNSKIDVEEITFIASTQPGEVTITATAGEASNSVTITLVADSDGDGRYDNQEDALGTNRDVPDDRVEIPGNLFNQDASQVLVENVPEGAVLIWLLESDLSSVEGFQAVRFRIWVRGDFLASQEGGQARLLMGPGMQVALEDDNPNSPSLPQPSLTSQAEGQVVTVVEGQVNGEFQLVELRGQFPIANLDRP